MFNGSDSIAPWLLMLSVLQSTSTNSSSLPSYAMANAKGPQSDRIAAMKAAFSVWLHLSQSVCLSVCVCLSACLSLHLSVSPSVCLYVCLSLSICLSLSVSPSVCLYVCLSVCLSILLFSYAVLSIRDRQLSLLTITANTTTTTFNFWFN